MENYTDETKLEIELRGVTMMYSAQIEVFLETIMLFSDFDAPNDTIIKFKSMTFENKITNAIEGLKKINDSLYSDYKYYLEQANEISDFRNKMAHGVFTWDINDLSKFKISKSGKTDDKMHLHITYEHTVQEASNEIDKIFDVSNKLRLLVVKVVNDFQEKFPDQFILKDGHIRI